MQLQCIAQLVKIMSNSKSMLNLRHPTWRRRSPSSCWPCCLSEEWLFLEPFTGSSTTCTPILHDSLTHRYHRAHIPAFRGLFYSRNSIIICPWLIGLDGRWDANILFLCSMSGMPDYTWKLQQVQQQLLQVSADLVATVTFSAYKPALFIITLL